MGGERKVSMGAQTNKSKQREMRFGGGGRGRRRWNGLEIRNRMG